MFARLWWHSLLGGKFGEARWSVRCGDCGSGEIIVGLADTYAVTPADAALPSWRVVGEALRLAPTCIGGNPRTHLGNNVVFIAFLLEGVAWYAAHQSAKSVAGILRRASGCGTSSFSSIRPS
jgi:hypothetical protein